MRCPKDGETLIMTYRENIEIDYCPKCRGVWLDRGELDKIIEQASEDARPQTSNSYEKTTKSKKKGLLGEIFDFFD